MSKLLVESRGGMFELLFALSYTTKKGLYIEVPVGFVSDYASVPTCLQGIIQSYGNHEKAAVIHDYLYSAKCHIQITRKEADVIFLEQMKDLGVSYMKRKMMYRAVRLFGGTFWRRSHSSRCSCINMCYRKSICES